MTGVEPLLPTIINAVVLAIAGFLLKVQLSKVISKVDKVISNQQNQQVKIAEIQKDLDTLTKSDDKNSRAIETLQGELKQVQIQLAKNG